MRKQRVLILGVTGMLGHVLFKTMRRNDKFEVFGTVRNKANLANYFTPSEMDALHEGVDAGNFQNIEMVFEILKPVIVINCIGLIKQLPSAENPIEAITINALLPHQLASLAKKFNARLIHISTDCVFDGLKGNYCEKDFANAVDLYGRSKYLGEVTNSNTVTIRTSLIGHELQSHYSLIDWFLSQSGTVNGYKKAVFSGVTTWELSRVILEYVLPNKTVEGLFHVSSNPISKYDLLQIVSEIYAKETTLVPSEDFVIDRSLDSEIFKKLTGYAAPSWKQMIHTMHDRFLHEACYREKRMEGV